MPARTSQGEKRRELDEDRKKKQIAAGPVVPRHRSLPCSVEDDIILACREAGVERVAIMVQEQEN